MNGVVCSLKNANAGDNTKDCVAGIAGKYCQDLTTTRPASPLTFGATQRGFTLVEVLVALSIVAIALTAGTQATLSLTRNAERQSDVLLAHVCAENEMVRARLSKQMPGVGDTRIDCEQANRRFAVALSVRPTPNPNFRRIDAEVFNGDVPVLKLSTVLGQF